MDKRLLMIAGKYGIALFGIAFGCTSAAPPSEGTGRGTELGVNRHVLNNPSDRAIGTGPVRGQVPAQREEQAKQLTEHDIDWRTTIIRHRLPNLRRNIAVCKTIQRQFRMPANYYLSSHQPLPRQFLQ